MLLLHEDFYAKKNKELARSLIGKILVRQSKEGPTSGLIVETETLDQKFETQRKGFLPGMIEVLKTRKGCILFVIGHPDSVVKIKALEPVEGVDLMKKRSQTDKIYNLCFGSTSLTKAMNITQDLSKHDLTQGSLLWITEAPPELQISKADVKHAISSKPMLDVKVHSYWLKGSPYVSAYKL